MDFDKAESPITSKLLFSCTWLWVEFVFKLVLQCCRVRGWAHEFKHAENWENVLSSTTDMWEINTARFSHLYFKNIVVRDKLEADVHFNQGYAMITQILSSCGNWDMCFAMENVIFTCNETESYIWQEFFRLALQNPWTKKQRYVFQCTKVLIITRRKEKDVILITTFLPTRK